MKNFAGKTAVVTGAASGIGLALAEKLARENMQVVLADVADVSLAAERHRQVELLPENLDCACDAGLAARAEPVQERPPEVHPPGPGA